MNQHSVLICAIILIFGLLIFDIARQRGARK